MGNTRSAVSGLQGIKATTGAAGARTSRQL
jgi:hypothetical protein